MVKFYDTIEWEYDNIDYKEKDIKLRIIEEKLVKDIVACADEYGDAYDIDICIPDLDKGKWIEWQEARRRILIILCSYIIDKCHILIKSGDIAVPYNCKRESDLYKWFKKNYVYLGIIDIEYHQEGIDYSCQYEHWHNCMINKFIYRTGISIEIEKISSNFIRHRHNVDDVDMIICYEKDIDIFYNNPKGAKVPILELSYNQEKMRELTYEEIEEFIDRPNVKKLYVENFLMNMGEDLIVAMRSLILDAKYYGWNKQTIQTTLDGILVASGLDKEVEFVDRKQKDIEEENIPILELPSFKKV